MSNLDAIRFILDCFDLEYISLNDDGWPVTHPKTDRWLAVLEKYPTCGQVREAKAALEAIEQAETK